MSIIEEGHYEPLAHEDDPDDYRPESELAVVLDPAREVGDYVEGLAVFPSTEITIRYVERNPAPGTEGNPPGDPLAYDVRELLEGDPARAVRPIDAARFESP